MSQVRILHLRPICVGDSQLKTPGKLSVDIRETTCVVKQAMASKRAAIVSPDHFAGLLGDDCETVILSEISAVR